MGTVLDRIVAAHREAAAADTRDAGQLREQAEAAPPPRKFRKSMGRWGLDVIAEVNRRFSTSFRLYDHTDPKAKAAVSRYKRVIGDALRSLGGAARTEHPFAQAPGLGHSTGSYLLGLMPPELLTAIETAPPRIDDANLVGEEWTLPADGTVGRVVLRIPYAGYVVGSLGTPAE